MQTRYPVLELLDQVRCDGYQRFSSDPAAAGLEREAERLVDEYCSDSVWLTGDVAAAPLASICEILERARQDRQPITVFVAPAGPTPAVARLAS